MSLMKENEARKEHANAESLLERHAEHKVHSYLFIICDRPIISVPLGG